MSTGGINGLFDLMVQNPELASAVVLVVFGGTVFMFLLGIRALFTKQASPLQERLRRALAEPVAQPADMSRRTGERSLLDAAFEPFARVARPMDPKELGRLRARLTHAGLRGERALALFLGAKVFLSLGLGLLILWLSVESAQSIPNAALFTLVLMTAGYYAPSLWLSNRIGSRQTELNHALPNALDLLVTCVEAGLGVEAAINRVADEITLSSPLLSAELLQVGLEIRAGMRRGDAFRRMAERTGVEELRSLSAIIVQTEIFGTSIAQSLRVQADGMRIRRTQRAEERAATASIKMTVPLITCILTSLFVVLAGPAVVNIVRILLPKLEGG